MKQLQDCQALEQLDGVGKFSKMSGNEKKEVEAIMHA